MKLEYEELSPAVRRIFMLGMQLCFALKDLGRPKEEASFFINECWDTMENGGESLRETLFQAMMKDVQNYVEEGKNGKSE